MHYNVLICQLPIEKSGNIYQKYLRIILEKEIMMSPIAVNVGHRNELGLHNTDQLQINVVDSVDTCRSPSGFKQLNLKFKNTTILK